MDGSSRTAKPSASRRRRRPLSGPTEPSGVDLSGVSVASDVVVLCSAVSGFVTLARARRLGFVVLIATALAAVAVISAQLGDTNSIARGVATVCAPLAMAASLHILLSLPDGSLSTRPMRTAAGLW